MFSYLANAKTITPKKFVTWMPENNTAPIFMTVSLALSKVDYEMNKKMIVIGYQNLSSYIFLHKHTNIFVSYTFWKNDLFTFESLHVDHPAVFTSFWFNAKSLIICEQNSTLIPEAITKFTNDMAFKVTDHQYIIPIKLT